MDDEMDENRKLVRLSSDAFRLYWIAIPWARRHKTGGRLYEGDVASLCAKHRLRNPKKLTAELLEIPYDFEFSLWTEVRRGLYEIHDFDEYNPPTSAERMRRKRAKDSEVELGEPESVTPGDAPSDANVTSHTVTDSSPSPSHVTPTNASRDAASTSARTRAGYPVPVPGTTRSDDPVVLKPPSNVSAPDPRGPTRSPGGVTSGLTTLSHEVQEYVNRWIEYFGPMSSDVLEGFRRVPFEYDRLRPPQVLDAIDVIGRRFLAEGKPAPPWSYVVKALQDLQARASDAQVPPRRTSAARNNGTVDLREMGARIISQGGAQA